MVRLTTATAFAPLQHVGPYLEPVGEPGITALAEGACVADKESFASHPFPLQQEQAKILHGCQRDSDCHCSDNVLLEAIQERASQSAIVNKTANCDATMDTAEVCCDSDCLCGAQCACGSNSRKSQPEVSTDMLPCVR